MSRIPNRESGLEWARMEFERAKLYAQWWIASATNGHAASRDIKRGSEPTPEQRANGECVVWIPLSDQEKISDAMRTAEQHTRRMLWFQEIIMCYINDNPESLRLAMDDLQNS